MIAAHVVSVPVTGLRGRRQLIMPIDRVGGYRSGTVMHVNVRKDICFPFHALAPVHLCSLCIESALKNRSRLLQLLSIVEKNRRVKGSELFSRNNNNNNPKRRFLNDSIYIYIRDFVDSFKSRLLKKNSPFPSRGNIWTTRPIYLSQTRFHIFSYVAPPPRLLVARNTAVAMAIGRNRPRAKNIIARLGSESPVFAFNRPFGLESILAGLIATTR